MAKPKPRLERQKLRGISHWPDEECREWFYSRTKEDADGCLIWDKPSQRGYGCARYRGRTLGAHVVGFILAHGPVPEGLQVNHHCDKRACVRGKCLYAGTPKQNTADMIARGRRRTSSTKKEALGSV